MKKKLLIVCGVLVSLSANVIAQTAQEERELRSRRSSLNTMIIEDASLPNASLIKNVFMKMPLPDKYNDHSLSTRSILLDKYRLTKEEKAALGAKSESKTSGMAKNMAKSAASNATGGLIDTTNTKYLPQEIAKYLKAKNIAKDLVSKWYMRDEKGVFKMDLIKERGMEDASEAEKEVSNNSSLGDAQIKDAAEELLRTTFVVVNRYNYISKKAIYDAAQRASAAAAAAAQSSGISKVKKPEVPLTPEMQAMKDAAIKKLTEGYIIQTTSYLYQLVWNDTVQKFFDDKFMMSNETFNTSKKIEYDTTTYFKLKFIGEANTTANVPIAIKTKRSDNELITIATNNATDAAIAKLQSEYPVFRVKIKLYIAGDIIGAKIGMKESLEEGSVYEVLKKEKGEWKRQGKIKVKKGMIWDNRMKLEGEDTETEVVSDNAKTEKNKNETPKYALEYTTFKGSSKFRKSMMIRQLK
jgi:hypothetical protein